MPQISVVMPVWNGERYLHQAVESVLSQSFSDFELIVVDDGSTDDTLKILRSYKDKRLQVLEVKHGGIVHALNEGIGRAKGGWIGRVDADDICLPHRLADQMARVHACPEAVLCYSDAEFFGDSLLAAKQVRMPVSRALVAMKLCFMCPIVHSTVLIKKAAFYDADGYQSEERHAEDFGLWGRLIELGRFVPVRKQLVRFRVHDQSASKQYSGEQIALAEKIAVRHCQRFMGLDPDSAVKAYQILRIGPKTRSLSAWLWFLACCVPRLRWKSPELFAWLSKETLLTLAGRQR